MNKIIDLKVIFLTLIIVLLLSSCKYQESIYSDVNVSKMSNNHIVFDNYKDYYGEHGKYGTPNKYFDVNVRVIDFTPTYKFDYDNIFPFKVSIVLKNNYIATTDITFNLECTVKKDRSIKYSKYPSLTMLAGTNIISEEGVFNLDYAEKVYSIHIILENYTVNGEIQEG